MSLQASIQRLTGSRGLRRLALIPALFGIVLLCTIHTGCGDDDNGSGPTGPVGPTESGLIVGTVTTTQGTPLAGVTVSAGSKTAITNSQGYFVVSDADVADRLVIEFDKDGYAATHEITKVDNGATSDLGVFMKAVDKISLINAAEGGIVEAGDKCSIVFDAGSLAGPSGALYSGEATIGLTKLDPTVIAELRAFPGKFDGLSQVGVDLPVTSYGAVDVTMTGGGGKLTLLDGKTATVKIPIADDLLSGAPETVKLWSFDRAAGKWREEGQATKTDNSYLASVDHFSSWMAGDAVTQTQRVIGRVVDGNGSPIQGARVTVTGANFQHVEPVTGPDGAFAIDTNCADVAVQAFVGDQSSEIINATCSGGVTNVGDLVLAAPLVTITLTWGAEPRDLDLHLAIPNGSGAWTHLYYPRQGEWVDGAQLNTDATSGYGPEILTIVEANSGVYRCSVHHYAGSGTLSGSNTRAVLSVRGVGSYQLTPPAGASGEKDVWRMWDITVEGGVVRSVTAINDYLHAVAADDLDSFSP